MTGEPDVIGLLQRADWTRLSISATVTDGSTVLIAPGRRYREQTPDGVRGCDGDRVWMLAPQQAGEAGHLIGGAEPPLRVLMCPAWLLRSSRLEVRGRVRACGREGLDVVVTARESPRDVTGAARFRIGRTEAVVDAELGILLRVSRADGRGAPEVTELVGLDVNPVIDAAQFTPPPGSLIGENLPEALGTAGPAFWAWNTAAGLAAGGLGAWIRYSPFGRGSPEGAVDAEAAMPHDDPPPEVSREGWLSGPAVGDEVLHLLHASGTVPFAATLHQWLDLGAMLAQVPDAVRRTGFGGLGLLISALGERTAARHLVSFLRVGGPGRYQIDRGFEPGRGPKTIACDGRSRWRVYRDKVTVGRAQPLPGDLADLVDASWLLECRLSDGTLVMARDRPAYRVNVARGDAPWSLSMMFSPAVAVVDAELGIVLSLTSYLGGRPVRRYELRDITTGASAGDFRVRIPPGVRTEEETDPWEGLRQASASRPVTPVTVAGVVAREVGREAAKVARNLLRRMGLS
jgi:hypothetical protein